MDIGYNIGLFSLGLILASAGLNSFGTFATVKASHSSDFSLVSPFMAFIPVFSALGFFAFLGQSPGIVGIFGIILVFAGTYVIQMGSEVSSLLKPFKAVIRDEGPRYMILASIAYGLLSVVDSAGSSNFPTLQRISMVYIFTTLILGVLVLRNTDNPLKQTRSNFRSLLSLGVVGAVLIAA